MPLPLGDSRQWFGGVNSALNWQQRIQDSQAGHFSCGAQNIDGRRNKVEKYSPVAGRFFFGSFILFPLLYFHRNQSRQMLVVKARLLQTARDLLLRFSLKPCVDFKTFQLPQNKNTHV